MRTRAPAAGVETSLRDRTIARVVDTALVAAVAVAAWIAIARSIRADAAGRGLHDRLAAGTMVRSLPLTGGPDVPA